jgi:hypothetical protein
MTLTTGVPIKSVVGLLLITIVLIVILASYVLLWQFDAFFIPCILGCIMIIFITVQDIIESSSIAKKLFTASQNDTEFEKCPDYWMASNVGTGNTTCSNRNGSFVIGEILDKNTDVFATPTVSGHQFNLDDYNKNTDFQSKCDMGNKFAWTNAVNKCKL